MEGISDIVEQPKISSIFTGSTFDSVNEYYSQHWPTKEYVDPTHNQEHYYHLEPKVRDHKKIACGPCNRSFFSNAQYKKHIAEHVKCPFPECQLSAHIKIIDQHISHAHMLINFESLQVDDEKWIADRKKRFPTSERAELRRAEQMERLKRGARIGLEKKTLSKTGYKSRGKFTDTMSNSCTTGNESKRKFNDYISKKTMYKCNNDNNLNNTGDNNFEKSNDNMTEIISKKEKCNDVNSNEIFTRSNKYNGKNYSKKHITFQSSEKFCDEIDLYDSDSELKRGTPAFKGMTEFFENTGELSLFGIKSSQPTQDCTLEISDEEEWSLDKQIEQQPPVINALCTLIGNYNNSGSDTEAEELNSSLNLHITNSSHTKPNDINISNSPTNKIKVDEETFTRNRQRKYHKKNSNAKNYNKNTQQKSIRPKCTNFNRKKRKPTLFERLLEPQIKCERNMILQCVRYIVNENYFEKIPEVTPISN